MENIPTGNKPNKGAKSGKKNRKHGRNKNSSQNKKYINENRREKNKKLKLARHLKKHPNDNQSAKAA